MAMTVVASPRSRRWGRTCGVATGVGFHLVAHRALPSPVGSCAPRLVVAAHQAARKASRPLRQLGQQPVWVETWVNPGALFAEAAVRWAGIRARRLPSPVTPDHLHSSGGMNGDERPLPPWFVLISLSAVPPEVGCIGGRIPPE
jgi:hypothetical protein